MSVVGQSISEGKITESKLKSFEYSNKFIKTNGDRTLKQLELFDFENFFGLSHTSEEKFSIKTNQIVLHQNKLRRIVKERKRSNASIAIKVQEDFIIYLLDKIRFMNNEFDFKVNDVNPNTEIVIAKNKLIRHVKLTNDMEMQIGKPIKVWSNYDAYLDDILLRYSLNLLAINID
ncbi:MAG: hypothetical protein CMB99_05295 [Flavobacteriaceae bacterium]|nr:hypothetical protein [Flavobacteriaceae bacterium]|tara:strand:+ start:42450 stop:42974 length:525 start_codon:yes stop_codon:yes gene_type:complete